MPNLPNRDPNEIGALWKKESPKGVWFSGTINGEKVVVFENTRKQNDNQPDYRVLKSKPKDAA